MIEMAMLQGELLAAKDILAATEAALKQERERADQLQRKVERLTTERDTWIANAKKFDRDRGREMDRRTAAEAGVKPEDLRGEDGAAIAGVWGG